MAKPLTQVERSARAVKALPASIRVLGFDIAIGTMTVVEGAGRSSSGEFAPGAETISVLIETSSSQRTVETFLHELLHAVWWASNIGRQSDEESVVTALGQGLMQVHRDNPWLAHWIAEHTR